MWNHLLMKPVTMEELNYKSYEEFQNNGIDVDLDGFDFMKRNSSKLKWTATGDTSVEFYNNLETTRDKLSRMRPLRNKKVCTFCKRNKEQECVYTTHLLKDSFGRVSCPILYQYSCPLCKATGPNAHTKKYCALYDPFSECVVEDLFRTPRNGTGKLRQENLPRHETSAYKVHSLMCSPLNKRVLEGDPLYETPMNHSPGHSEYSSPTSVDSGFYDRTESLDAFFEMSNCEMRHREHTSTTVAPRSACDSFTYSTSAYDTITYSPSACDTFTYSHQLKEKEYLDEAVPNP